MLFNGRIDLTPMDETMFWYACKKLGYKEELFEKAFALTELNTESYLVASLAVPNDMVKKLQNAWLEIKNNNTPKRT